MTDERASDMSQEVSAAPTLDGLVRLTALRQPDAIALTDPPNRASFMSGAPRTLTYAALERAVGAFEAQLRELGMPAGSVVGLQLPNTVEGIVTLLGVLRAHLSAALIPLYWSRAQAAQALARVSARALVVCGRVGMTDYADLAREIAGDTFTIRYVCGFGESLPDGVVSLDHVWSTAAEATPPLALGGPDDIAVVTLDDAGDDIRAVRRSHAQLLAGGLAVMLEAALPRHAAILSTLLPSSFGSLAAAIAPWALTGGRLALHHPFDPATFVAQLAGGDLDTVAIPGLLLDAFAAPEHPGAGARVIALWRSPEQQATSIAADRLAATTDVLAFGEAGIVALARAGDGAPRAIPLGPIHHPSAAPRGASAIATDLSPRGTLTLAGPMVAPQGAPIDTGLRCRLASGGAVVLETAPAPTQDTLTQPAPAA